MTAELVIHNARIATMNPAAPFATALAVVDGRIAAIGADHAVAEYLGPATTVINAQGRRVIPGLIDSHMHLLSYGFALERIGLADAFSLAEVQRRVAERVRQAPPGAWIIGRGWNDDFFGGRLPDRHLLDAVAPDHPVWLSRRCGHLAVANTRAMQLAHVWEQSPRQVEGGVIDRDADGWPTGIFREMALDLITAAIPAATPADYRRTLRAAAESAARHGVTGVHTNDEGADVCQAYQELQAGADRLPLRVWWDMGVTDFDTAVARGWHSGQGDEWFKIGSLKLFADGSLGGHTAALKEPYADDPGERGLLIWETERMAGQMARARRQGLQVAVHAIGDGAAEQVLQAFGQAAAQAAPGAGPVHPAVARLRLIHCQIMFPALWAEMLRLGAVAEVQPRFVASDYPIVEARVGAARAAVSYAWRSMGELGIPLAFGSDCPVEPVNPLHAIYAAVTRQTMEGEPEGGWLPQERLTVAEAIAGHTRGAAYAVGEEREQGQLAPGYLGDLVMLEQDPFVVPPAELKDIEVAATVVGGRVVFARG